MSLDAVLTPSLVLALAVSYSLSLALSQLNRSPCRMGKLHIFKMPSTQYKWRSEVMTVLPITTATGRVVAGQLGQSIVHVEDLNLEMNKQSAVVMVRIAIDYCILTGCYRRLLNRTSCASTLADSRVQNRGGRI